MRHARSRRRAGAVGAGALLSALLAAGTILTGAHGAAGTSPATASQAGLPLAGAAFNPELGLPATNVVAFGASPQQAPGEVWAYGRLGSAPMSISGQSYSEQYALLEHAEAGGWQVLPLPPGPEGKPLTGPGREAESPAEYGALAGQATGAGGVALLAGQHILTLDPGGQPRLVPAPGTIGAGKGKSENEALAAGESLLPPHPNGGKVTVPYAAIEEATGGTGLLIAPYDDGDPVGGKPSTQPGVLHYDGSVWTREPIELPEADEDEFTPLALACGGTAAAPGASSPENCWLLADARVAAAKGSGTQTALLLFERKRSEKAGGYAWEREPVSDWLLGETSPPTGVSERALAPLGGGAQMLTATAQGLWVDFQVRVNGASQAVDVSELVTPGSGAEGGGSTPTLASVAGTWCFPTGAVCSASLGAELPERYRSFAWPAPSGSAAGGSGGDPGTRIITGLPDRVMLELGEGGGGFSYTVGPGGEPGGAPGGAAFSAPGRGWIADGLPARDEGPDGEGQAQAFEVSPQAAGDELGAEAVPFRRPLLAVAQAPGTTLGAANAPAIAVGVQGQVARYTPGQGWTPEALYNSAGQAQTPNLRGVAWPEPNRAYAVGDEGAMWVWRAETGLWEPDPAEPFNFIGNLTAIAFSSANPQRGYAVGKQGVLLRYDKSWEQETLPASLQQANFTSVAFAGEEALATYRVVQAEPGGGEIETGGLAIEDGSGWQIDPGATALLEALPPRQRLLSKAAGLPDGGAVAAGPGIVIERESASAPWQFSAQPLPEAQNVSALGAFREGGSGPVRALVSVDLDSHLDPMFSDGSLSIGEGPYGGDNPISPGPGQPAPFFAPDPLPDSGYLLQQTATGWSDLEHQALPVVSGKRTSDLPIRPDPVLALLVNPAGGSALAVGGQTDDATGVHAEAADQTAAAMRFPASAASSDGASPAPVPVPAGQASFLVGGGAACAQPCADFAAESLGPDVWLEHALRMANTIAAQAPAGAVRAFLYTGERLQKEAGGAEAFERELARYASLLGSGGGPLPVYAADSADTAPASVGYRPFADILAPYAPGGVREGGDYYMITTSGASGGPVRLIVLDFASGTLGAKQEEWLAEELLAAKAAATPAVVMGNDSLGFTLPDNGAIGNEASPAAAAAVTNILVQDEASAYLFDYPGSNVAARVGSGARSIPAYGSGTLGYVLAAGEGEGDRLGEGGFLLASVHTGERASSCPAAERPGGKLPSCNEVTVTATVVPNIGQLALDATNGVLLRRSEVALFEALARRPLGGEEAAGSSAAGGEGLAPDPYDPIPFNCQGPNCAYEVPTEYTFSSSDPEVGDFVEHEAGASNPRQVQLGADKLPVPDSHSGLFCAYNEGTTTVSITTGGLTYSEPIHVYGGSVEYPCGTVPLKNPPLLAAPAQAYFPLPQSVPPTSPAPVTPHVQSLAPPPSPPPPAPAPVAHHHHPQRPLPPVPQAPAQLFPVLPLVPPPAPGVARPTPPSGTAQVPSQSPVSQQVEISEREKERQGATEMVHHMTAYRQPEETPLPSWPIGLILIGAAAGVGFRGALRWRDPVYARQSARRGSPDGR